MATLRLPEVDGADAAAAGVFSDVGGGKVAALNLLETKQREGIRDRFLTDLVHEQRTTQTFSLDSLGQREVEEEHSRQLICHRRRNRKRKVRAVGSDLVTVQLILHENL